MCFDSTYEGLKQGVHMEVGGEEFGMFRQYL